MSRVRTNQITNSAGTGAPNFPNGVTVTGLSTVTGNSQSGGNPINGAAQGTLMGSFGGFNATRTTSTSSVFLGYTEGDSVAKVDILANGSATFVGNVTLGATAPASEGAIYYPTVVDLRRDDGGAVYNIFRNGAAVSDRTIILSSDGTGVFDGNVRSNEGYVVYPPLDSNYAFATRNAANSTWTAFIEANGKATFAGNVVLSTAGTGIDFSATGDGSGTSTSELLDDYEEGTWTPTTTNFTHTNDATECRYTKIGRMVYLTGQLGRDQASTPTSAILVITGLPYLQSSVTRSISGNYWLDNLTTSDDYMGGITYSNNTTDIIFGQASTPTHTASSRYIQGNYFDNGRGILFSLTYITD